jgi:hypothetical protein
MNNNSIKKGMKKKKKKRHIGITFSPVGFMSSARRLFRVKRETNTTFEVS